MNVGSFRARLLGRSLWSLKYLDGKVINEWDMDWTQAPLAGRRSLRLYAPNGQMAEVTTDLEQRLFQFKQAELFGGTRRTLSHVIGVVDGDNGECQCHAWEYDRGQLLQFRDNVRDFKHGNVGTLSLSVLGVDVHG